MGKIDRLVEMFDIILLNGEKCVGDLVFYNNVDFSYRFRGLFNELLGKFVESRLENGEGLLFVGEVDVVIEWCIICKIDMWIVFMVMWVYFMNMMDWG